MRRRRSRANSSPLRLGVRGLALTLAVSLVGLGPVPAAAHEAGRILGPSIEQLYAEGQNKFANDDFTGAAQTWTKLLDGLPESKKNRATRENVLLNVISAYREAYARTPGEGWTKDVAPLRQGKSVLDQYLANFKTAYGGSASVSTAVQEAGDELVAQLEKAEEQAAANAATKDPEPDPEPEGPKDPPPPAALKADKPAGMPLIISGGVLIGLGLGTAALIAVGAIGGQRAEEDFEDAQERMDEQDQDDADQRGKTMNALTITGAILTPLLIGGGATLLVFGIRQRKRSTQALSPAVGPGFAGIVWRAKF